MKKIAEAQAYMASKVLDPALAHPHLDPQIKNSVANAKRWIDHFQRVGDLLIYLKRFEGGTDSRIYQALKQHGLYTFEDIVGEFENRFSLWAEERTRPSDFIVGEQYTSFDILIFAQKYDTRAGGMFVIGANASPEAVIIKATLKGERYENEWFEPHQRLKYYLKSRSGVFKETFVENAAIINHPSIPIYTFVRPSSADVFTYEGIFQFQRVDTESDGSKWFELYRQGYAEMDNTVTNTHLLKELDEAVQHSLYETSAQRQARLALASKKPKQVTVQTSAYLRNADVIAEVLRRAEGYCEACKQPAPFRRKSNGTPYLEVHHRIPLAEGGEDTVTNAIALCPNCHRQAHYG